MINEYFRDFDNIINSCDFIVESRIRKRAVNSKPHPLKVLVKK